MGNVQAASASQGPSFEPQRNTLPAHGHLRKFVVQIFLGRNTQIQQNQQQTNNQQVKYGKGGKM